MKSEIFDTQKPYRSYLVDFLKFVCIILVILSHSPAGKSSGAVDNPGTGGAQYWLFFCVPLFFLLSGYTWTLSWLRQKDNNVVNGYKPRYFFKKLLRIIIPGIIAFLIIEVVTMINIGGGDSDFFKKLFEGGLGNYGSYYIVIMFQMLILFPLLFLIVNKFKHGSLVIFFVFNCIAQLFLYFVTIPAYPYCRLMLRYTCFIGFGIYLGIVKDQIFRGSNYKITIPLAVCFVLGIVFVSTVHLGNFDWFLPGGVSSRVANQFGALYLCPIIYVLFKKCTLKHKAGGFLGKMSFSFFLTQGIIFSLVSPNTLSANISLCTLYYFLICLSVGIAYYYAIEGPSMLLINKLFKNKKQKAKNKKNIY